MTDSDMLCEKHPDSVWPHDTCLGPGIPHPIIQRERATIADLQAQLAAAQGDTELAERIARQNAALVDTATERINELETELSEATAYGAAATALLAENQWHGYRISTAPNYLLQCPECVGLQIKHGHNPDCRLANLLADPPAAVKALLEKMERWREALEFYAEWDKHLPLGVGASLEVRDIRYLGAKARDALSGEGESDD